ncbi:MAG: 4Fe-4S binding protein [Candidatus Omnitrophica bacterium]|nr:4Fe-4S binding protein [Candidatus Omnitrophota bacterium]
MAKIKIDSKRCKACNLCIVFCPFGHIKKGHSLNKVGYKPVVFLEKKGKACTGCCACAIICPEAAIEVYK